jgi:CubicO group peptidase (beta-lactamase class C family)
MTSAGLVPWLGCVGLLAVRPPGAIPPPKAHLRPLVQVLEQAVADGDVVGAQIVVGNRTELLLSRNLGRLAPGSDARVNDDTLFCIGSCSKPIAAACVLALADRNTLGLDDRVGKWLPAFRKLEVAGGAKVRRAPTVRELLAHRGGIYSQKDGLTTEQRRAIRDYTLPLAKSVAIIARQKLLWQPGSDYAYSGAGYCVAGRVAEVAAGKPFEALFQETLARPLGLKRTTYFPAVGEKNVAVGGRRVKGRLEADPLAPHRQGAAHRLPLIGGGLYSTARESAALAQLFLRQGRAGGREVLSPAAWQEITRRQYPGQDYGLGWHLGALGPKGRARALDHNGSLASYRSVIRIDLAGGHFMVAHWTLSDPAAGQRLAGRLNKAWQTAAPRLRK